MAELTSTSGLRIKFDPKNVAAVADHSDMGAPGTFVYGIIKQEQQIAETIDAFLTRLGIKGSFVQLTRIPATSLWVNVDAVDYLRQALPTDTAGTVSVISVGGAEARITQSYDVAATALNAACNKF